MPDRTLIIGTRGSHLAIEQANRVRARLSGSSELEIIKTSGDRFTDKPLHEQDGVGLFTKEIEGALLEGAIDLAVHSLKDLPVKLAEGLELGAILRRDSPSDLLLVRPEAHAAGTALPLKQGARVGASSLRRQALMRQVRSDLVPTPIRGNVPTRIEKVRSGEYDAIVLSRAGLERLGLDVGDLMAYDLNPGRWAGAPGQGTIAVEIREADAETRARVAALDDPATRRCVLAERELLTTYGGGCHAPFGAWATEAASAASITVAAPGTSAVFVLERFEGASLEAAVREGVSWIRAGRPPRSAQGSEEWICRPAQPWC